MDTLTPRIALTGEDPIKRLSEGTADQARTSERLRAETDPRVVSRRLSFLVMQTTDLIERQYDAGVAMEEISKTASVLMQTWNEYVAHTRVYNGWDVPYNGEDMSNGIGWGSYRTKLAFIACLLARTDELSPLSSMIAPGRGYQVFDLLLRPFLPGHPISAKAPRGASSGIEWDIYTAICTPADQKAAAISRVLRKQVSFARHIGVPHFAYSVALIVCGWDIDDSSFCDHPHYPKDLVRYYREHIRNTRDAWRQFGEGAGIALPPPPPPKRVDLAKSKRKGVTRWVELASDGDVDAVEEIIEQIGKPRKLTDIFDLSRALAGTGHGICADIKDDSEAAIQASALAEARGWEFAAPVGPPHGPAGVTRCLRALDVSLREKGYVLMHLDNQDDAWHLVAVAAAYADELLTLSGSLGIRVSIGCSHE